MAQTKEQMQDGLQNELTTIIQTAVESKIPHVEKAIERVKRFKQATQQELQSMFEMVSTVQAKQEKEKKTIQEEIFERVKNDIQLTANMNQSLKTFKLSTGEITYSLVTNKMDLILNGTKTFLNSYFDDLYDGKIPKGYEYTDASIPILGENPKNIWGSSKATFLKTAGFNLLMTYTGKARLMDLPFPIKQGSRHWIDESAMVQITPFPKNLKISEEFEKYSYCFSDTITPQGLSFPHNGYAMGGHRGDLMRHPNGKPLGPEDCSSWTSKISGFPGTYTTADQLLFYRAKVKEGLVSETWLSGPEYQPMSMLYDVMKVRDPQKEIKIGQIYCHRTFASTDPNMTETLGTGGHTVLVLGMRSNGNIVTLGVNRDMPNMEGPGIQEFTYSDKAPKKSMLFSVKAREAEEGTTIFSVSKDTKNEEKEKPSL